MKKAQSSNKVMNTDLGHRNKHDPSPEEIIKHSRLIRIENNERDGLIEADYQREPDEYQPNKSRPN